MFKKVLLSILVLLLLAGGVFGTSTAAQQTSQVNVFCVLIGVRNDGGWSQTHYEGCTSLTGDNVKVLEPVEGIFLEDDFVNAVRDRIVNDGANLIFAASAEYQPWLYDLADEFPNVRFEVTDPLINEPRPNLKGYYVRYYEGNYVCGFAAGRVLAEDVAAGRSLENKIAGVMTSLRIPLTYRNLYAWIEGVRAGLGKDIPGKVQWLGDLSPNPWFNPEKAKILAEALIDDGAVLMNTYLDDPGVIALAQERSTENNAIYSTGITVDLRPHGPDTNVCNVLVNWNEYYQNEANAVLAGTWTNETTWASFESIPVIEIGPLGEFVSQSIADEVGALVQSITDGSFRVLSQFNDDQLLRLNELPPNFTSP